MQLATTQQFRNAVRKAAKDLSADVSGSWTNSKRSNPGIRRWVGLQVFNGASAQVAKRTEELLSAQGLTAKTRLGRRSTWMVRGTCTIA